MTGFSKNYYFVIFYLNVLLTVCKLMKILSLKKVYSEEIFLIALLISLVTFFPDFYLKSGRNSIMNASEIHPPDEFSFKRLDKLLNYKGQQVSRELNRLGRHNKSIITQNRYLRFAGVDKSGTNQEKGNSEASLVTLEKKTVEPPVMNLSQASDGIWSQDVDLGFSFDILSEEKCMESVKKTPISDVVVMNDGEIDKLVCKGEIKKNESPTGKNMFYDIDTETGEYILKGGLENDLPGGENNVEIPLPEFILEEALQYVKLDDNSIKVSGDSSKNCTREVLERYESSPNFSIDVTDSQFSSIDLTFLEEIFRTPQLQNSDPFAFQANMPFVSDVRKDLVNIPNLLSPADAPDVSGNSFKYQHEISRGTQNHSLGNISGLEDRNLGSAIASSINLINNTEPIEANTGTRKINTPYDMVQYLQNPSSCKNQTRDCFSTSLNNEDLQLIDMVLNEEIYTMRMLDNNNSMSSSNFRNCSIDGINWMRPETVTSVSGDCRDNMYRTNGDYTWKSRQDSVNIARDSFRLGPVVKENIPDGASSFLDETPNQIQCKYDNKSIPSISISVKQTERSDGKMPSKINYSCTIKCPKPCPANSSTSQAQKYTTQKSTSRVKSRNHKSMKSYLTRDEKRAKELNITLSIDDITNLPMEEFNDRLSKHNLSEPQLSLIRDIRRRGKNKLAAQNCRKRKLNQIINLADEVQTIRDRKQSLLTERDVMIAEKQRITNKFEQLYQHVYQHLQDKDSLLQFSLKEHSDTTSTK